MEAQKTIVIGGDHAGFHHKQKIKEHLEAIGIRVIDKGPFSAESVDYPDFVHPCVEEYLCGEADLGILVCGSGNGVAITANKYKEIRCGLCWTEELAVLSRQHNNANFLAIPGRFISDSLAIDIVDRFITTGFDGGRHARRVDKMVPDAENLC